MQSVRQEKEKAKKKRKEKISKIACVAPFYLLLLLCKRRCGSISSTFRAHRVLPRITNEDRLCTHVFTQWAGGSRVHVLQRDKHRTTTRRHPSRGIPIACAMLRPAPYNIHCDAIRQFSTRE